MFWMACLWATLLTWVERHKQKNSGHHDLISATSFGWLSGWLAGTVAYYSHISQILSPYDFILPVSQASLHNGLGLWERRRAHEGLFKPRHRDNTRPLLFHPICQNKSQTGGEETQMLTFVKRNGFRKPLGLENLWDSLIFLFLIRESLRFPYFCFLFFFFFPFFFLVN